MALYGDGSCILYQECLFFCKQDFKNTWTSSSKFFDFSKKSESNRGAYKREMAQGRSATIQGLLRREAPISN
jgi:hypothetical protein